MGFNGHQCIFSFLQISVLYMMRNKSLMLSQLLIFARSLHILYENVGTPFPLSVLRHILNSQFNLISALTPGPAFDERQMSKLDFIFRFGNSCTRADVGQIQYYRWNMR